jgi:hypothetical protein
LAIKIYRNVNNHDNQYYNNNDGDYDVGDYDCDRDGGEYYSCKVTGYFLVTLFGFNSSCDSGAKRQIKGAGHACPIARD